MGERTLLSITVTVCFAQLAFGEMVISEWMYNGLGEGNVGEFVEFTNTGPGAVDMTGWSYDDSSRIPGAESLSGLGIVAPGQSVIFTDDTAEAFAMAWGLSGVTVLGGNTNNLGRSDEINLYDAGNNLVDRLTYNDQAVPKQGPRTAGTSCSVPDTDYGFDIAQSGWTLSTVGDQFGGWMNGRGEVGSPGQVPEPMTLMLMALSGLLITRRRA